MNINRRRLKLLTEGTRRKCASFIGMNVAVGNTAVLDVTAAASTSGTFPPIVPFKQFNKPTSVLFGRGTSGVFSFPLKMAVLLYPSSVNATLLAR